ncbi:YlbE-like family protein [Ornithinibacillus xuwenensis]|jgi:YlbE-like protein|uniref:YlbE-like family protein n=1 Tax=Ornithinibacillus xuwenensis TaxID=3144668 RepID=A0ABU9XE61_9BACI
MHKDVYNHLQANPELLNFVRHNPEWYRYLTRNPSSIMDIHKESKQFYGKTFSQRLDKANQNVQMIGMLLQFAEMMKD